MGDAENREAAFIARMTASTTHELRNVLAVVKESAGLVEDLTLATQRRQAVNPDKFLQAARRIDAQVVRAADLLTSLNRLAHGLDHASEAVDLVQQAHVVCLLYQRFARMRRLRLDVDATSEPRLVQANTLRIQMAIAAALDCCLQQLPEDSEVTFQVGGRGPATALTVTGQAPSADPVPPPDRAEGWQALLTLVEDLGGTVALTDAPFGFCLLLADAAA
jgi:C4-dicarboxylate-specific signal transduction histidine kinase